MDFDLNEETREKIRDEVEKARRELKNVTIRGIDPRSYEEFSRKVRDLEINIGDAVNRMMETALRDFDDTFPDISSRAAFAGIRLGKARISHHRNLKVTKQDLIDADARVSFSHIERLVIAPDVDRETFKKYIRSIQHCRQVFVPKNVPKLLVLSKVSFCKEIEYIDADFRNNEPDDLGLD